MDYRQLLKKYIQNVGAAEGDAFAQDLQMAPCTLPAKEQYTEDDKKELLQLFEEIRHPETFTISACVAMTSRMQVWVRLSSAPNLQTGCDEEFVVVRDLVKTNMEPPGENVLALSIECAKELQTQLANVLKGK